MTEEVVEEVVETTTEEKPRPKDLPPDQEWDKVNFAEADPETIQRRFNRVYGSMKVTENALKQAAEDNRKLAERLEAIENESRETKVQTRLESLKAEKAKAFEEDDFKRVAEIDDQILDLKTPKQEKEPPKEPPKERGWFTPDKEQRLVTWAAEMDDNGNYKRPWAQENHPKHARAVEVINGVLNDPDFGDDFEGILKEVDRLMTPAPKVRQEAAVLTSEGAPPKPKETIQLTEEQKLVARKMYNDLPPKEAIERYMKALKRNS